MKVKIKKIRKLDIKVKKYDIEVKNNHNFFANNILMHNSTIYNNGYYHPRSVIDDGHKSRDWLKGFKAKLSYLIGENQRVCGENMYAEHSIKYDNLKSYFYIFNIWWKTESYDLCYNWDTVVALCKDWSTYLNEPVLHVPVLYDGKFDYDKIKEIYENLDYDKQEGIVCRTAHGFYYEQFQTHIAKAIRPKHITTDEHWSKTWKPNKLKK